MQEKTKESLSFDTTTSNNNANSNRNNYCHNHDQTILNKLSEQDEQQQGQHSAKLIFNKIDSKLNALSPSTAQKMIVNQFQLAHNVKNPKLKKSKKAKKKKLSKSLNSRESNGLDQNSPSDKFDIDCDSLKDNESIRWQNELVDTKKEDERIELYKINRRKRYIEQKNKIVKMKLRSDLACDLSSSSTCSFDNLHSKNFHNNLENIVEVDKLDSVTTDQTEIEANALVQDRNKSSRDCLKREKETDSAISSISSNSQMFY
ncbi:hypothetical protein BpHYR1_011439 [Brachionus plicatilis]|uniref:Uncharacterized protein n=1 Tax=Brachionus plicatilis TaxID=10195 RepID=A0A3M7QEP7_BRAPC|nr:hypothetical protein BpHYR1_011439 [Brachionus plicatilis]